MPTLSQAINDALSDRNIPTQDFNELEVLDSKVVGESEAYRFIVDMAVGTLLVDRKSPKDYEDWKVDRECSTGYTCGSSCISRKKACLKNLTPEQKKAVQKLKGVARAALSQEFQAANQAEAETEAQTPSSQAEIANDPTVATPPTMTLEEALASIKEPTQEEIAANKAKLEELGVKTFTEEEFQAEKAKIKAELEAEDKAQAEAEEEAAAADKQAAREASEAAGLPPDVPERLKDLYDYAQNPTEFDDAETEELFGLIQGDLGTEISQEKIDSIAEQAGVSQEAAYGMGSYVGRRYKEMNSVIYSDGRNPGDLTNEEVMLLNKGAIRTMSKLPPITEDILNATQDEQAEHVRQRWNPGDPLVRNMKFNSVEEAEAFTQQFRDRQEDGDPHTWTSFMSTTFDQAGAGFEANEAQIPVQMLIQPKLDGTGQGKIVDNFKTAMREREVLYAPMTQFNVSSARFEEATTRTVTKNLLTQNGLAHFKVEDALESAEFEASFLGGSVSSRLGKVLGQKFSNFFEDESGNTVTDRKEIRRRLEELTGVSGLFNAKGSVTRAKYRRALKALEQFKGEREDREVEEQIPARYLIELEEI